MNQPLPYDEAIALARQIYDLYCSQDHCTQTMGEWVLTQAYPEACVETLGNGRNFCGAHRPTDSRFYLIGMLASGRLAAAPLRKFAFNLTEDRRLEAQVGKQGFVACA
jgi:hypothetical protein